jgi:hypothetical protein
LFALIFCSYTIRKRGVNQQAMINYQYINLHPGLHIFPSSIASISPNDGYQLDGSYLVVKEHRPWRLYQWSINNGTYIKDVALTRVERRTKHLLPQDCGLVTHKTVQPIITKETPYLPLRSWEEVGLVCKMFTVRYKTGAAIRKHQNTGCPAYHYPDPLQLPSVHNLSAWYRYRYHSGFLFGFHRSKRSGTHYSHPMLWLPASSIQHSAGHR